MYPGYFAFCLVLLFYYKPEINLWIKRIGLSLGLLFCTVSFVLGAILPVIKFPKPSGHYSVGLQTIYLEDSSRQEVLTQEIGDKRKLTVHVWYPSDEELTKPERYMDNGYAEAFTKSKGIPSFIASHFDLTNTNTQKLLPITLKKQFPVIILSHGLLWNSKMYTSIVEEIVSNGYIVVGIDHSYEAFLTEYKGKQLPWSQSNIDSMNIGLDFAYIDKRMKLGLNEKNEGHRSKAIRELIQYLPYFESFDRWSNDISFVIDQLEVFNKNNNAFLYQKLNLNQIGLLGHSWGGAAVVQNASVDNRVKAVINMDGAQWGSVIDTTLQKPLMVLHADRNYQEFFTPNFYVYDHIAKNDYYLVTIGATGHANFGDLSYWTKIHSLTETGSIDPKRMSHITNNLIRNFFDKYLHGKSLKIRDAFLKKEYPEVEIVKEK
ncbi:alpha/beta hydrolase [Aquimarina gracilis]